MICMGEKNSLLCQECSCLICTYSTPGFSNECLSVDVLSTQPLAPSG